MPVPRPPGRPPTLHPYLDGPHPRAYAHRGWHLDELAGLENTMAAFSRAVDEGFGYLELDVHATADGVAVVHHDRVLDRTTDARGPLAARTAAQLDRVRVVGAHRREPLPHLADVLAALPHTRVTVELKSAAAIRPVLDVLARLDAWHRVCLAGYHEPWLQAARRLARAQGAPLFTSMGHTSVVGLRVRGWASRRPLRGDEAGGRPPQAPVGYPAPISSPRPVRPPGRTRPEPGWVHPCAATSPSSPTASPVSRSSTPTCCGSPTAAGARCTCGPSTIRPSWRGCSTPASTAS